MSTSNAVERWPALPYGEWKDTCETLQLWMQIVGKVKLTLSPFLNELWNVGFHLTARGMTTGTIPNAGRVFEIRFDFVDHTLAVLVEDGRTMLIPLAPRSVADFYADLMGVMESLGIGVSISTRSVEISAEIQLDQDREHNSYDPDFVQRWWRILLHTESVLQRYRSSFAGKSSPVLFYWGSFDLAHARYSGRPAPLISAPRFFQIAEDEENVSCGFWPGNPTASGVLFGEPAFYSYTNPAPPGLAEASVQPNEAHFDPTLGEFILRYEDARRAPSPDDAILQFFETGYAAGASLGSWDRDRLERDLQSSSSG